MKASELMICDWVTVIQDDGAGVNKQWSDNDYIDTNAECCEPIPLTPEILKTNGFKEVYKSTFQTIYILQLPMGGDFLEYVFLACSDNCFKIFLYGVEREKTYINNVHQLQQALRLCGLNDLADNFKV